MRHYLMIMEFILDILHSFLLKKKMETYGSDNVWFLPNQRDTSSSKL